MSTMKQANNSTTIVCPSCQRAVKVTARTNRLPKHRGLGGPQDSCLGANKKADETLRASVLESAETELRLYPLHKSMVPLIARLRSELAE